MVYIYCVSTFGGWNPSDSRVHKKLWIRDLVDMHRDLGRADNETERLQMGGVINYGSLRR
jgi:predicted Rdx family selenoprotein